MIRLTVPSIDDSDREAVRDALSSGHLVQGPRVAEFETAVASHIGVAHAMAVANGTCALHLALMGLGVGPGDICIVPAYSWIATANVVELLGARPIFVDIYPDTFNMDVDRLEETLETLLSNRELSGRVKAVMPVHAFGQMADMESINLTCAKWEIPVVEDAACALGASRNGRQAGTSSVFGCFSFHPRKAVTTGEGGMIVTNDPELARKIRTLRNHGADPNSVVPDFVMPGYNYRLTEIQGALGITQMAKLSRIIGARKEAAARYDAMLTGTALSPPVVSTDASHVYQSYVTLMSEGRSRARTEVISKARERGVELQIGTIHMPLTTFFRTRYSHREGEFPVTDAVASRALSLPLYESITCEQQREVVDTVLELVG